MALHCMICGEEIRGETILDHYKDIHPLAYERYLKANKVARRRDAKDN